jgi:penicillin G amidase
MVVELGPEVRAWGTYPGGQSGDPASPRYLDRLRLWRDGRLEPLFNPRSERDIPSARNAGTLVLEPGRKMP